MDKIAVLIPCYNEALTIRKVVEDAKRALPEAAIYVYDNNSTDDTVKEATEAGAIIRYEKKQGKGNVVRAMFEQIDAECYIIVDADDTYGLEAAPLLADSVLKDGADMAIGDRLSGAYFTENKRAFHGVGNKVVRSGIRLFFHQKISDVMTGFRAFSRRYVKSFLVESNGFEIETEMTIYAIENDLKITSYTIEYRDRPEGSSSKLNTVKDGIKVLRLIHRSHYRYHPLRAFGEAALCLLALDSIPIAFAAVLWGSTGGYVSFGVAVFAFLVVLCLLGIGIHKNKKAKRSKAEQKAKIESL